MTTLASGKKKIMIITADPKTLMCHRSELLEHWASLGVEIVAVAHGPNPAVAAYLRSLGGKLLNFPLERNRLNPLADFKTLHALVRAMQREQPDAVFAYTLKCVGFGSLAAEIVRIPEFYPLICGLGFSFGKGLGIKQKVARWGTRLLLKSALKNSLHVFFQNKDDQREMRKEKLLPDYVSSSVLPGSGVDTDKFRFLPLDMASASTGRTRFLFVSRLLKSKGAEDFAKAAKNLRRLHPHWEFHLLGGLDSGPDGVPIEEVRRWQAAGDVIWHGETANVMPHLQAAHVVVLPSVYREGVPRCLLEALSVGRPVITTDAIGCRETVTLTLHGEMQRQAKTPVREGLNGLLIEPGNQDALEVAMARLGDSPKTLEAMSQAARQWACDEFRVELVIQLTCEAMYILREPSLHEGHTPFDFQDVTCVVPDRVLTPA